ncbi:MAG: hypothetical protein WAW51_16295, partial [Ilumatobacteraceae bacterium]
MAPPLPPLPPLPTILHADLDAFYASVEQLLDPALRGRPIAVGGGVVLAASYEAKAHGVHGGMSGWRAKQLCPALVFVGGHFSEYQRLADQVMAILGDFTPFVQRISIDEAFLDVAGTVHLFGPPGAIAQQLRSRVRDEVGLPISVGAAATKHLAKIASQVAKPDGVVVVDPRHERDFLDPLPVGLVWGIGPVTQQRLADRGIRTIGQLAASPTDSLEQFLGRALGSKVGALAANRDHRKVQPNGRAGSVGAQSAFGRRDPTDELLRSVLGHLADRVMAILGDFTPYVQRISIDEAFLDVAGTVHLFGPPASIAQQLRTRVRDEVGLPISVGAAATKHLAKIASQVAKPDGLVVVDPAHEREFLHPLPVGLVWGIGPVTQQRL